MWPLVENGDDLDVDIGLDNKPSKRAYTWGWCDDVNAWEAQPVLWSSPVSSMRKAAGPSSSTAAPSTQPRGRALKHGEPTSIVLAAARAGFRGLSVSQLEKIAKAFGWPLKETETELDVVKGCLHNALGKPDEDELMKYAHMRLETSVVDEDFVNRTDVWDCVDETDLKEIEAHKEDEKKENTFKAQYEDWRSSRATAKTAPRKKKNNSRRCLGRC